MKGMIRILIAALLCMQAARAMDGVCIATILGFPTYQNDVVMGQLVRYEIVNDSVTRVDTLNDKKAGSPKINMSGTYYAYVAQPDPNDGLSRALVIKPLYGNENASVSFPLQRGASWIWWVLDSTFFYTVNPVVNGYQRGQNQVRKLTLRKSSSGKIEVSDHLWVTTPQGMQAGYVGIDLTGTKLTYKESNLSMAFVVSGDSTKAPTPASIGIPGCGNSLSPSGEWWTSFPGGHSAISWGKWDASYSKAFWYRTLDSSWAVVQSNDPLRYLQVRMPMWGWNDWIPCPIGIAGNENNWSQNSEKWFISEVHAGFMGNTEGNCVNAVAINITEPKAINISKIPPIKQGTETKCEFRYTNANNPGFPGGTQLNADRPILWCSSRADVWEPLWPYIENREADNQRWSEFLGLPPCQIPGPIARIMPSQHTREASLAIKTAPHGSVVVLPRSGEFSATVTDIAGRRLMTKTGHARKINIPSLARGYYIFSALQEGSKYTIPLIVP